MNDLVGISELRSEFTRFMMAYKFGLDEVTTKINILKDEFGYAHEYNPIEHVTSRLKSPESIVRKAIRKEAPVTFDGIRKTLLDIAGVRITCSFISDAYEISDMLTRQRDVNVVDVKDYIAHPKPNGYKSLHVIVEIPVFMSDRVENVFVEIQIRTIAMDFWASLEHKIFYKYDREVPESILAELRAAAATAHELDVKMERLHDAVTELDVSVEDDAHRTDDAQPQPVPRDVLETLAAWRIDRTR
ncbi:GTP pyrophosphokinase [Solicola gregarius]|uniref:GTP pyrophosphokinase family protein n=1 Tax=Solicola gregarius TaxID=2908642 RepID=A0AA46TH17_9ACTN|nr:GTP pyrophosphokinase family protein [Solicola gregarius]UYM05125.1 GTP pyrophosphokinase family protein [Solicola gregarius]